MTGALASFISDFWQHQLVEHDRQYLFLVLVGFVGSFAFIRLSTRIARSPRAPWWPGSIVSEGGVHVHHLVFGIWLMVAAGTISFAGFATSPIYEICALLFGIGAGLTIDEFALWVHLDDVYWAKEGRSSVDATVVAAGFMALVLLGVNPFEIDTESAATAIITVGIVLVILAVVAICFAKGRFVHGSVGIVAQWLAVYGACRLAKPNSPWARRLYGARNPDKQRRSEARFHPGRRTERFKERFRDAIGGAPDAEYQAKLAARAGDAAPAEEVRARADGVAAEEPVAAREEPPPR